MLKILKIRILPWEYPQWIFRGTELSLNTCKNSKGWAGRIHFPSKAKIMNKMQCGVGVKSFGKYSPKPNKADF